MITLLVPLTLIHVSYEVGSGRPYSELETLVLEAIARGANSTDELKNIFCLPSRLIVEVLVTLARAGWIAISTVQGAGFRATQQGEAALHLARRPEFATTEKREEMLLMEAVTGQLIQNVRFESERDLRNSGVWNAAERVETEFYDHQPDEGKIRHLLPVGSGYLRWIGSIRPISRGYHWLKVQADPATGELIGLPNAWHASLRTLLLERAAKIIGLDKPVLVRRSATANREALGAHFCEIDFQNSDLLITNFAHREALKNVLDSAHSRILIATAFINIESLNGLKDEIERTLDRGVNIDVLWGYAIQEDSSTSGDPLKWLLDFRKRFRTAPGQLRFNQQAIGTHAKLLLFDSAMDCYAGYVGSYNWLSSRITDSTGQGENVSILLRHPSILAALGSSVGGIWRSSYAEKLSEGPSWWRRVANQLEERHRRTDSWGSSSGAANTLPGAIIARCVRDQEHEHLLRELLLDAQQRCLVVSHKVGPRANIRLSSLFGRSDSETVQTRIIYGQEPSDSFLKDVVADLRTSLGSAFQYVPRTHSKLLIADDRVLISSYNFLSADPFATAKDAKEIGILIQGEHLADELWKLYEKRAKEYVNA